MQERKIRGEKEKNIVDASSKQTSETKTEKIEQEHQSEIQMEELVEVVRIDKEKCEFTTPVMITKIGPVKPQMEELVEVVRIDKEKCEFTTPVMITKIGEVGDWKRRDVVDEINADDEKLGKNKNDTELVEIVQINKNESTDELEKTKNDKDLTFSEPYILLTDEREGKNASKIYPSKRSENISETMVKEGISMKNETVKENEEKAKRASTKETAKVMENMEFVGIEKCGCTDQVPVLVLDRLKKIEKVNEEVEVKIFKVDLDLDDSASDLELTDKTKKSLREKPLRWVAFQIKDTYEQA